MSTSAARFGGIRPERRRPATPVIVAWMESHRRRTVWVRTKALMRMLLRRRPQKVGLLCLCRTAAPLAPRLPTRRRLLRSRFYNLPAVYVCATDPPHAVALFARYDIGLARNVAGVAQNCMHEAYIYYYESIALASPVNLSTNAKVVHVRVAHGILQS